MLRNYIKVAWRNIVKSKTFSFINVLGLALGMTCSLLILLWVQDERSINRFHANGPRLYQVMENQAWTGNEVSTTTATPGPMAQALTTEIPEVEKAVKITWEDESLLAVGEKGPVCGARPVSTIFLSVSAWQPQNSYFRPNSHCYLGETSGKVFW